jgi:molecular chaperone GrpE
VSPESTNRDGDAEQPEQPETEAAPAAPDDAASDDADPTPPDADDEVLALRTHLAERTADLQRLQAEYVNYKRRVDRDRESSRELVIGSVLTELLGILDDVGRAREAGELEGAFKAVAESLERVTEKLGLVRFGEKGDTFDPRIHEALLHNYSDEVDGPTATMVMQPGYRLGERILRPARVAVSEPTEQLPADAVPAETPVETTDDDKAADKSAE